MEKFKSELSSFNDLIFNYLNFGYFVYYFWCVNMFILKWVESFKIVDFLFFGFFFLSWDLVEKEVFVIIVVNNVIKSLVNFLKLLLIRFVNVKRGIWFLYI